MSIFGKPRVMDKQGRIKLKVRGEDQLWSYKEPYYERIDVPNAAAGNNLQYGTVVPVGEVWVVETMSASNDTSPCTYIDVGVRTAANWYNARRRVPTAAVQAVNWSGRLVLENPDKVFALWAGCLLNDDLYFHITGHKMTLEV